LIGVAIAAFGVIAALLAAAVWVISIVRADGRERAAALVLAEKIQGESNVERTKAAAEIGRLASDVRRQTRRADALETFARGRLVRSDGSIDDGFDLLLAELSIVSTIDTDDDRDTGTAAARSDSDPAGTVFIDPAELGSAEPSGRDASGPVPEGETR
jgi:hypothetical protein